MARGLAKYKSHYSEDEQAQILKDHGVYSDVARNLAIRFNSLTFEQLRSISKALQIIKKGKERQHG